MKTDYIKWIITVVAGLTAVLSGGGRLTAQTTGTAGANTYSNSLSNTPKADPTITVVYPALTKTYACFGDTIYITATADDITDLTVPQGADWEGDKFVEKVGNTITKRFFVYKESSAANPVDYEFTVKYNVGTYSKTLNTIYARSCPPELTPSEKELACSEQKTNYGAFNLGYSEFKFKFINQTSKKEDVSYDISTVPDQHFWPDYNSYLNKDNRWELTNRVVQSSDADISITVHYNQGTRSYTESFDHYKRTVKPLRATVTTVKTAYCTDEKIDFTVTLQEDTYQKLLDQREGGYADKFQWQGPSTVEYKGKDPTGNIYYFSAPAAGSSDQYRCTMLTTIKYIANRDATPIVLDAAYTLPSPTFTYHAKEALTQTSIDNQCAGDPIDLSTLLPTGSDLRIEGYGDSEKGPFTKGHTFNMPTEGDTMYVQLQAIGYTCSYMTDGKFVTELKLKPLPSPTLSLRHPAKVAICQGEPLQLSATTNAGAVQWTWTPDGGTAQDITPQNFIPPYNSQSSNKGTIKATASNRCGTATKQFDVQIGAKPDPSFNQTLREPCPGDQINVQGQGGNALSYQLFDLRTGESLHPAELGTTGLMGYTVRHRDSLLLLYTAQAITPCPGYEPSSLTCTDTATARIIAKPAPFLQTQTNLIGDHICAGDELVINTDPGLPGNELLDYPLQAPDGSAVPGGLLTGDRIIYRIPDIPASAKGHYTLTVNAQNGCSAQEDIYVLVDVPAQAAIQLAPDAVQCEGATVSLTANVSPWGNYTYRWLIGGRLIEATDSPTILTAWQRGDRGPLRLEVEQAVCTSTDEKDLTIVPLAVISSLPADTGLCTGQRLCLSPTSDLVPDRQAWYVIGPYGNAIELYDGADTDLRHCIDSLTETDDGRYYMVLTKDGCQTHSDTVNLTVYPQPDIRIEGPDFICDGDTVTLAAVSETPGTNRWSPSGQTTEAIRITKAGRYAVTRTSTHGCANTAETSLEARPRPIFKLADDTSFCRGTAFMVYGPAGMDEYLWQDGLDEKDRLVEEEGWYILTVFRNECAFTDSLFADETFCGQFHFPTAFSPNDNRINDTWGAISAAEDEDMAEFDLMVFDRNGKKVFHGKRLSEQWDGRYKGRLCPPGVYTYSFRATEKKEGLRYRSSGTVTIVL